MYVTILGRQPHLGLAELERVFGGDNVTPLSSGSALVQTSDFDIERMGGTLKAGQVTLDFNEKDWQSVSNKIIQHYSKQWYGFEGKLTLGVSVYGFNANPRDVQKVGITLKQRLKKTGVSLRLVPNQEAALSTATSHHNKLGLSANKVELLVVRGKANRVIIAESTGAQNITAYANRDQKRPKRDAFVGMLPPKLAQIMINLSGVSSTNYPLEPKSELPSGPNSDVERSRIVSEDTPATVSRILDPFCGTGVILQEAALMGYAVYGTDLSEKMIRYSRDNLNWLADTHHIGFDWYLHEGDATTTKWQQPIDAVVGETYLGQPFSAPPSPEKLVEVRDNCNHIISTFLTNLLPQIQSGTPVCIAVPAWRNAQGEFTHLPLIETIARLGFRPHEFRNVSQNDLLYYREDQIVARELLVLVKS